MRNLTANPGLVKTMSVKPPVGAGQGAPDPHRRAGPDQIDLQPCGGTHVARTGEIGRRNASARSRRKAARTAGSSLHLTA